MSSNKQKKKKPNKSLKLAWSIMKYLVVFIMIGGLLGVGAICYYVNTIVKDIKEIDTSGIYSMLSDSSVILSSSGEVLENVYNSDGLRTTIKYQDIGQNVIDAFIAVEDKTFYDHPGFNYVRLVGAFIQGVTSDSAIKGTSTITQQLARNIYLEEERLARKLSRKIEETYITIQIEQTLTKDQIIEAYLNKIFLGANSNGIQAAAQTYFSKDAKDLDLVESAMLACIPKSPRNYAPMITKFKADVEPTDIIIDDIDKVYTTVFNTSNVDRYLTVLRLMFENGKISETEFRNAGGLYFNEVNDASKSKVIDALVKKLNPSKAQAKEITYYFVDMIKADAINALMETLKLSKPQASNLLYTGGLKIYSTIDVEMQKKLESAYSTDSFTDYFGQTTESAVKLFQKSLNLSADGIIGKGTLGKLITDTKYIMDDFSASIYKKGMTHADVVLIKSILKEKGFFSNSEKFPKVVARFDKYNNIISKESGKLLLYRYENLVNENKELVIPKGEFEVKNNGDIVLFRGKRLNFYSHYKKDDDGNSTKDLDRIQIDIKESYIYNENSPENTSNTLVDLYRITGKDILVPDDSKTFDENKNVVIDNKFLKKTPDFVRVEDDKLYINQEFYVIADKGIIQPQSAMVVIDYRTGQLKAIVGGRNISGQKIFNRAIQPQQPGSSVKPIGPYSVAIESREWTAASVIDDVPVYLNDKTPNVRWPHNWYENKRDGYKYKGIFTLRQGIERSNNVLAVTLSHTLGVNRVIEHLKNLGITSIDEDGGQNDINLSAVSLGGMTKGISPYELASAYGTYANGGIRVSPITFTKIVDSRGKVLVENKQTKTQVIDEQVAFIIHDMMRSGVTSGLSNKAQIKPGNKGIPVAGKTGTTSNQMDAVFVGYTPYYVASLWFGGDDQIPLDQGSSVAAKFWSTVMTELHEDLPDKNFEEPSGLVKVTIDTKSGKRPSSITPAEHKRVEYFIKGTEPKYDEIDDVHYLGVVCKDSGKQFNEYYCPIESREERVFTRRLDPNYNYMEHLDKDGNPFKIKDEVNMYPSEICNIHTPGTVDLESSKGPGSTSRIITTVDGTRFIQEPFYLLLNDGSYVTLPQFTKVLIDNSIVFPNGKTIYSTEYTQYNLEHPYIPQEEIIETAPEESTNTDSN